MIDAEVVDQVARRAGLKGNAMRMPIIFWVEDSHEDVQLMQQALTEAGVCAQLILADNAVLAFRYFQGRDPYGRDPRVPDLILIDLNLPIMSGKVVLDELRETPRLRHVPAVILTTSGNEFELERCRELGAIECITKPTDGYASVVERLRHYLPAWRIDEGGTDSTIRDPAEGPCGGCPG